MDGPSLQGDVSMCAIARHVRAVRRRAPVSAILDDLAEWDGEAVGWKDAAGPACSKDAAGSGDRPDALLVRVRPSPA